MFRHVYCYAALLLLAVNPANADTIKLKSGKTLNGTVETQSATSVMFTSKGKTQSIPRTDVDSIILEMHGGGRTRRSRPVKSERSSGKAGNVVLYREKICRDCDFVRDQIARFGVKWDTINVTLSPHEHIALRQKCLALHLACELPVVVIRGKIYPHGHSAAENNRLTLALQKEGKRKK